jgi:hypothetical protein
MRTDSFAAAIGAVPVRSGPAIWLTTFCNVRQAEQRRSSTSMAMSTHNSDGNFVCPIREFRQRLHTLICRAGDGSEKAWNQCQGELVDYMFDAIHALHRVRRERFTDAHDEIANASEAANKLVVIDQALRRLRRLVMTDETLESL